MQKTPLRLVMDGDGNALLPLCNFAQLIRLTQLAPATLERAIQAGELKSKQAIGKFGTRLFALGDISDFLAARKTRKGGAK